MPDYKMIFSKNLLKAMKLKHKTQADIIRDLKVNKSTISTWCNGTRLPRMDMINELANYLGINKSDLIEDKAIEDQLIYESLNMDFIRIPLYPPICCGNGGFVDDDIIEFIPVPSKGLSANGNYFCQIADGESMKDAGIDDGDLLVFEKTTSIDYGRIGCFCIDENEAMCKKYTRINDLIVLQPMNSDYEPIIVDPLNECFKCLGVLKKSIKDFGSI